MRTQVRRVGQAAVIEVAGKVTVGPDNDLLQRMIGDLLDEEARRIVLDLGRVSYMDSSGLGVMIACQRAARERGADVVLLRPSGKVQDLLDLSGVVEVFSIYEIESQALTE